MASAWEHPPLASPAATPAPLDVTAAEGEHADEERPQTVRFPRPKTGVAVATQIAVEGWLRKKGSRSVLGKKPWNRRYFVLYANSSEIRYYGDCAESLFGNLPLDERGSIPLEFVTKIVVPEHDAARGGKRFDLITSKIGDHPYPRDAQAAGQAVTASGGGVPQARCYSFEAPTVWERQEWVRALRALTGLGGVSYASLRTPSAATPADGHAPTLRGRSMSPARSVGYASSDGEGPAEYDDADGYDSGGAGGAAGPSYRADSPAAGPAVAQGPPSVTHAAQSRPAAGGGLPAGPTGERARRTASGFTLGR